MLAASRHAFPFIAKVFADSGYAGKRVAGATAIAVEIVRKNPDQVGFAVQPRRWVVERFFAGIGRNRRLAKDFEATLESALSLPLRRLHHAAHPTARAIRMSFELDSKNWDNMVDQGFVVHRPKFFEDGERQTEAEFLHRKARFEDLGYVCRLKMDLDLATGRYRSADYAGPAGWN